MDMSDCNWGEGVALWGFNHSLPYAPNSAYLPFLKEWVERGLREKRFQHTVNTSIPCIGIGEVYKQTNQKSLLDFMVQQADFLLHDAPRLKMERSSTQIRLPSLADRCGRTLYSWRGCIWHTWES